MKTGIMIKKTGKNLAAILVTGKNLAAILVLFFFTAVEFVGAVGSPWPGKRTEQSPGVYWWAPGSAYDRESIDFNLEQLSGAGIGTVHIVPIYGAKGYEKKYIKYLSPEWISMLDYIIKKAGSLSMNVDMTTGTGWCFGGPRMDMSTGDIRVQYNAKNNSVSFRRGRNVKRAAPGGEGLMIDPYSPRSMKFYLEKFSKALCRPGKRLPRAQYHDSFEYSGNWCPEMFDEFKARRGYDLKDHLPELFGRKGDSEIRARVLYDYRKTLAELHYDCMQVWNGWAHSHGMLTRNEAHGSPGNLLDLYAASDIPETEMFGAPAYPIPGFRRDPQFCRTGDSEKRVCMFAASAAHIAHKPGRQLVSSESCTWLREHWHTTLGQVKLELDEFFLSGINHIFYHGSCYSPKDIPWPGWFFYASTEFNPRNAFWHDFHFLNDYVRRCQSVLQAGRPSSDVLLYWPVHDSWMSVTKGLTVSFQVHNHKQWLTGRPIGIAAQKLIDNGYTFDYVSDNLLRGISFKDKLLQTEGGSYRAILVPRCNYMPVSTMRKLADLADQGARVIFEDKIPGDVPGLYNLRERREKLVIQIFRARNKFIVEKDAFAVFKKIGLPREMIVDVGLNFIRRRVGNGYFYFIANLTGSAWDGWSRLSVPFASAQVLDPLNGSYGDAQMKGKGNSHQVRLQLAPGSSIIIRTYDSVKRPGAKWKYYKPAGRSFEIKGRWTVKFIDGGPALPEPYKLEKLSSWTGAPDQKAKAFAGTARYSITFALPENKSAADWLLDLGDVRESARILINGRQAGGLFCLPFSLPVGKYLKRGANLLEIEVTNLSANRIRDLDQRKVPWKIMGNINIVTVNYRTIEPGKWPLQPSGLLGPVTLTPLSD